MTLHLAMDQALLRWLGAGMLNGCVFTLLAWLMSVSLLRGTSARLSTCVWTLSLASFVVSRPVQLRALPLSAADVYVHAMPGAWRYLGLAYLAVIATLGARMVLRQYRLRRMIADMSPAPQNVQACVRAAASCLSLVQLPDVRVTEQDVLPFTVGPLRASLILPRWLCVPGARLDAVVLHELSHLARRDHWLLAFERAVTTLFFFWPPVLWAARRLEEARELACDEHALTHGALPAPDYGQQLLDVVCAARAQRAWGHALALGRRGPWLERRIDSLLAQRWAEPMRVREALALVLLLSASLVGLRVGVRAALPHMDSAAVAHDASAGVAVACDGTAMSHAPP